MMKRIFVSILLFMNWGCDIQNVSVNSLGRILPAPVLSQKNTTSLQLKINNITKRSQFAIGCDEFTSSAEISFDAGSTWETISLFRCNAASTSELSYSFDILIQQQPSQNIFSALIRTASDRGFSEATALQFIRGFENSLEQFVSLRDHGGFINSNSIEILLSSKFSYGLGLQYEASEVYITTSSDCSQGGAWYTYSSRLSYNLPQLNGTNSLYFKFRDAANNESSCLNRVTVHDTLAPSLLAFGIDNLSNASPSLLKENQIQTSQTETGQSYEMKLSSDSLCLSGDWELFSPTKLNFDVPSMNSGNLISLKTRDRAQNESNCIVISFTHDQILPALPTIQLISPSTAYSRNDQPVFKINNLEIGSQVKLYADASCQTLLDNFIATGSDYWAPSFITDKVYQIHASVTDLATNELTCVGSLFNYTLDTQNPSAASLIQTNGTPLPSVSSNLTGFNLNINYPVDVSHYRLKYGNGTGVTECADSTTFLPYQRVALNPFFVDFSSLSDGAIYLCLSVKDFAGNVQSTPTIYSWNKSTSSPIAVINSPPNAKSKITSLNIDIDDTEIQSYKYKLGLDSTTDCTISTGYSSDMIPTLNITDSISGLSDGPIQLCVVGIGKITGSPQPESAATTITWIKDTTPPFVTGILPPADGTYYTGDTYTLQATFNEDITVISAPVLNFTIGGSSRTALFSKAISANTLQFQYRLQPTDSGSFSSGGVTGFISSQIQDIAGNNLNTDVQPAVISAPSVIASSNVPTFSINETFQRVKEDIGFVTVQITASTSFSQDIQLEIYSDGTAVPGVDYTAPPQQITFLAGQTFYDLNIPILSQPATSDFKKIVIQLRSASKGLLSNQRSQLILIHDVTSEIPSENISVYKLSQNSVCIITEVLPITAGNVYCWGSDTFLTGGASTLFARIQLKNVLRLESTASAFLAQMQDGSWKSWGSANYLGTGASLPSALPSTLAGLTESGAELFKFYDLGSATCASFTNGKVKCWGDEASNSFGIHILVPTEQPQLFNTQNIVKATTSSSYCGWGDYDSNPVTADQVKCWGDNRQTQLGDSSITNKLPQLISGLENTIQIVPHSKGFCSRGDYDAGSIGYEVKCWGSNERTFYPIVDANNSPPILKTGLTRVTDLIAVSSTNLCALGDFDNTPATANKVKCWGSGSYLAGAAYTAVPQLISTGGLQTQIFATSGRVCSVDSSQTIKCWSSTAPVTYTTLGTSWTQIKAINDGVCVFNSGEWKCRANVMGNTLSDYTLGAVRNVFTPNLSLALCTENTNSIYCKGTLLGNNPIATPSPTPMYTTGSITDMAEASSVILADSSSPSWQGTNKKNFTTVAPIDPFERFPVSKTAVLRERNGTYCFLESSDLKCWGKNLNSELGTTSLTYSEEPLFLAQSVSSFTISKNFNPVIGYFGCYIQNALLNCWGGLAGTKLNLSTLGEVIDVSLGTNHMCAIFKINSVNKLKCWATYNGAASNNTSQLGDGTTAQPSPWNSLVEVIGVNQPTRIQSSGQTTCALDTNQSLFCWGHLANTTPSNIQYADVTTFQLDGTQLCYLRTNKDLVCATTSNITSVSVKATNVNRFWLMENKGCAEIAAPTNQIQCWGGTSIEFGRIYEKSPADPSGFVRIF